MLLTTLTTLFIDKKNMLFIDFATRIIGTSKKKTLYSKKKCLRRVWHASCKKHNLL